MWNDVTRPLAVGLLCAASACSTPPACPGAAFDEAAMTDDVTWLASPALDGRAPGSAGDEEARAFVEDRFACLGLEAPAEFEGYQQPFTDSEGNETANVIGYLPGADATVGGDILVVSAHVDHFGDGRLGANDNASGIAGLLAIAQAFSEGESTSRTVVFAVFGAEESGDEGSASLYAGAPDELPTDDFVYDVNMDMIGSYTQTGTVWALGSMAGTPGRASLDLLVEDYPDLDVGLGEPSDQSDNQEFCLAGVPYVFFWTEDPDCYHRKCDTADRIDYPELVEIAELTGDLAEDLANTSADLRAAVEPGTDVCGM